MFPDWQIDESPESEAVAAEGRSAVDFNATSRRVKVSYCFEPQV
jgi:hypothetical protein